MFEKSDFIERTGPNTYVDKRFSEDRALELVQRLPEPFLDSFYVSLLVQLTVLGRGVIHEEQLDFGARLTSMDWLNEIMHLVAGQIGRPADKRYPPDVFVRSAFERARKGGLEVSLERCFSRPLWSAFSKCGLVNDDIDSGQDAPTQEPASDDRRPN